MDISGIGRYYHNSANAININFHNSNSITMNNNPKKAFDKGKIEAGCLVEITPVDDKKKTYDSYLREYMIGITMGKDIGALFGDDLTLEGMYKYSMEEFEKIENSTDDDETKAMRRVALEEVLKNSTYYYADIKWARSYKLAPPEIFEKDKNKQAEMRVFNYNQQKAIKNSVKKLTLNFFAFIKNNIGGSYEDMLNFVNKNSTNNRDINNLSTTEVSGFFDYAKSSNYMHSQSNADADYYKGYFSVVSNGSANNVLDSIWKKTAFDNEIYQKYSYAALRNK